MTRGLDLLQYDLLYGKRYSYNGADLYPASDLVMGIDKVHSYKILQSRLQVTEFMYTDQTSQIGARYM